MWLWRRPAAAAAPIRPLAWEPAYALVAALLKKKKKKVIFARQNTCSLVTRSKKESISTQQIGVMI